MTQTAANLLSPAKLTRLVDSLSASELRQRLISAAQELAELPCECDNCEPPCIRCGVLSDIQEPKNK